MQELNHINSAIKSNRQMYQNLSNSSAMTNKIQYSSPNKVQYYNDEVAIKKEKKKETNKKVVALFTGISGLAIALATAGSIIKKRNIDVIHAIKSLGQGFDLKKLGFSQETIDKATNGTKNLYNEVINGLVNFGSVRDDYASKLVNKTENTPLKFIKKGADNLRDLYNKWTKDGARKGYCIAKDKLQSAVGKDIDLYLYDEFFEEANKVTLDSLTQKGKRVTDGLFGTKGNRPAKNELIKKLTSTQLADEKITELYEKYLLKTDDILDKLPENADKTEAMKAIKEYNKIIRDTIERLRDTNIGNPISDMAGILVSLGGLGTALATAENKEERKSISINLGIPIITTIASIVIGSAKSIGGAKSMVFGAILGVFGSTVAKVADNATKGKPTDLNSLELKA